MAFSSCAGSDISLFALRADDGSVFQSENNNKGEESIDGNLQR